jgi:biopolymer transport protein ExbB
MRCFRGVFPRVILLLVFLQGFYATSTAQPAGYLFGKSITIQSAKIGAPGPQVNFPVLVSVTDPNLRTVANGGHVQNINGYDIVFTLADCTTLLKEQIESYNPVTGNLLVWVLIPSLPSGSNYIFGMFYDNILVVANPSTTAVWDANYKCIYHLDENPGGVAPQYKDATSNARNGTTSGMVAGDQVAGIIGNAGSFNTNKYVNLGAAGWFNTNSIQTFSVWANYAVVPAGNANFVALTLGGSAGTQIGFRGGIPLQWQWGGVTWVSFAVAPSINVWHYYAFTWDGTSAKLYIDGVLKNTTATLPQNGIPNGAAIGAYMNGAPVGGEYFTGILDEARISIINRSAAWILTEYNNQFSPATFYTFSAELAASAVCAVLPITLTYFRGQAMQDYNQLYWETSSEINNNYFSVERTVNGVNWNELTQVKGAGNSTHTINYSWPDDAPQPGVNYYRLKQVDYDGNYTYSNTIALEDNLQFGMTVFPNPSTGLLNVNVTSSLSDNSQLYILDVLGQTVYNQSIVDNEVNALNLSYLSAGIYFVKVVNSNGVLVKKIVKQD